MKYDLNKILANPKGNSLIQVIVAAGIAAIVSLVVAGMMAQQNKAVKSLGEKLLTYDLQSQL